MARYTRKHVPLRKARRDGAVLFGLVVLVAVIVGEAQLQLIPEGGPLVLIVYLLGTAGGGAAGAAMARWYLESTSPAIAIIVAPPLSLLAAAVILPGLFYPAVVLGGLFALLAIGVWPIFLGGGLVVSLVMYWRYGRGK